MVDLNKDVKYVKTVGPNRVKLLNKLKIYTLKDLITYYPRDYEDRSKPKNLYECTDGEEVLIEAMAAEKRNLGQAMFFIFSDAIEGNAEGIEFKLVSADGLNFKLLKID